MTSFYADPAEFIGPTVTTVHLADHDREVAQMDRISALYAAVAWLVHGETTHFLNAMRRLDDDVVALAGAVGTSLSVAAEQVIAERLDPFGPDMPVGGFPLGAGARRAL